MSKPQTSNARHASATTSLAGPEEVRVDSTRWLRSIAGPPPIVRREKPLVTFTEEDRARTPRERFARVAAKVFSVPKTEIEALTQRPRVKKTVAKKR